MTAFKSLLSDDSYKVVLAEDNEDDVLLFKLALTHLPMAFQLTTIQNGTQLTAVINECMPDIIFLDIDVPYLNGLTGIAEIRKKAIFDNVPVILLSANQHKDFISKCYLNRANFYMVKRTKLTVLTDNLRRIFNIDWKKGIYYPTEDEFVLH